MLMPDPTLLVIEDAREHAILVRVAARRALPGLDVRVAGDGREGIAYLAGTPPFQDRRSHPVPSLIILDLHVKKSAFVVGGTPSIADLSLCGYLFWPDEFGVTWAEFPAIAAWLERIKALPGWAHPYDLMPGYPLAL